MANIVKLKRSATASAVPTTAQLQLGELAMNTFDGKLFLKKNNGTESIVEFGSGGMTYPSGTGIAVVVSGTSWGTTLTAPLGAIVGTTDTQTLTNKTLTDPAIIGTTTEDIFTITDSAGFEIDPANGSIQTVTLGANRTPAATNFVNGKIVLLGINDGTAYTITWTTVAVTWVRAGGGATAPTLAITGFTWVILWKVNNIIYGTEVGKP